MIVMLSSQLDAVKALNAELAAKNAELAAKVAKQKRQSKRKLERAAGYIAERLVWSPSSSSSSSSSTGADAEATGGAAAEATGGDATMGGGADDVWPSDDGGAKGADDREGTDDNSDDEDDDDDDEDDDDGAAPRGRSGRRRSEPSAAAAAAATAAPRARRPHSLPKRRRASCSPPASPPAVPTRQYPHVRPIGNSGLWRAGLRHDKKRINFGGKRFPSAEAAAREVAKFLWKHGRGHDASFDEAGNPQTPYRDPTLKSQYIGVHPSRNGTGTWTAQISVGNEIQHLGSFATEVEAAVAYDAIARPLGRPTNFALPPTPPPKPPRRRRGTR
jgi:hypothetical protein